MNIAEFFVNSGLGFLFMLVLVLLFQIVIFSISLHIKRNDIVDVAWGFGFIVMSYIIFFLKQESTLALKVALFCISMWGFRLMFHVGTRFLKHNKEDRRYAAWRSAWKYVKIRSFFQIFVLQGIIMTIILIPFTTHAMYTSQTHWLLILIGFGLWCLGFYYQATGDFQLSQFIENKKKTDTLLRKGVWSQTRHPNYFGEICMWWGVWLILLGTLHPVYMLVTAIGPAIITLSLRYVSGVPMLELHWKQKYPKQFALYEKTTPMLVPKIFSGK